MPPSLPRVRLATPLARHRCGTAPAAKVAPQNRFAGRLGQTAVPRAKRPAQALSTYETLACGAALLLPGVPVLFTFLNGPQRDRAHPPPPPPPPPPRETEGPALTDLLWPLTALWMLTDFTYQHGVLQERQNNILAERIAQSNEPAQTRLVRLQSEVDALRVERIAQSNEVLELRLRRLQSEVDALRCELASVRSRQDACGVPVSSR